MPYTSEELTHFVGRSLSTNEERFDLLCQIIRGGVLLDPAHVGRRDPKEFKVTEESGLDGSFNAFWCHTTFLSVSYARCLS